MTREDHEQTVTQASEGSRGAIEALLEKHLPGLHAFVRLRAGRLIRAREETEDVVQSACREVLRDLAGYRYRGEAAFRQWLYEAALRKLVDKHRFHKAAKRDAARLVDLEKGPTGLASDQGLLNLCRSINSPSRVAMAHEDLEQFERAFARLPGQYREAILMDRVLGLDREEMAKRLGKSPGAVRTLVSRALSRLAALIDQGG